MGFLDKLKGTGVLTDAEPQEGVAPLSAEEVRRRLLAISGKGIETGMDEDDVVVAWSAKVQAVGPVGAGHEYRYRALKIELDEEDREAKGIGIKTDTDGEITIGGNFSGAAKWERGQHMGTEKMQVLAWLGPHRTEGGADEEGYKFSWGDLREPVIEAVTGAGWTYKPKRL